MLVDTSGSEGVGNFHGKKDILYVLAPGIKFLHALLLKYMMYKQINGMNCQHLKKKHHSLSFAR